MNTILKITIIFFTTLFLNGCGPKYIIKNEYIPPTNEKAGQCLETCNQNNMKCVSNCNIALEKCKTRAVDIAEDMEKKQLINYHINVGYYKEDYQQYMHQHREWERNIHYKKEMLDKYEYECNKYKSKKSCLIKNDIQNDINHLKRNQPLEPIAPSKPNFNSIVIQQQSLCTSNCGCQESYDGCYSNCGGKVIFHKICVENCD